MRSFRGVFAIAILALSNFTVSAFGVQKSDATPAEKKHSYLFAWCGDIEKKSSDFLAVIDAEPSSKTYGKVLQTVTTGVAGTKPHHTEIEMPSGGMLMANGFESGRTWIFDLRKPLEPRVATSFGEIDGYMHPHTFFRLKNGNVLATFQYRGSHEPNADGGGILEIDNRGHMVRSGSAIDAAAKGEVIRPYSIELLPDVDRMVSTNTPMHEPDGKSRTVQVWQLSTLKVLRTLVLPEGPKGEKYFPGYYPGEPRLLEDGKTVLVHTFSCGLYMMRGVETEHPSLDHVYSFPGDDCGVPLRVGHWWLQTIPATHSLTVFDISDPAHPKEVSRVTLDESQKPHWISIDRSGKRIVLNSDEKGPDHRLFIINFDVATGAVKLDENFRDVGSSRPGVSMDGKTWPHGFTGNAYAHGTVFSR